MKKFLNFLLILLTLTTYSFSQSIDIEKSKEQNKSKAINKSKSKSTSQEESDITGTGKTEKEETGFNYSEIQSISKTLEKLKNDGVIIEVSLPQLIVMELSNLYPELFSYTVNDFYTVALSDDDGSVYTTRINYFNSLAVAQKGSKYLKSGKVIGYIKTYLSVANQIKDMVYALNGQVFGIEDYNEIVKELVKDIDPKKEVNLFPISNKCILYGSYQKFKCGACVLDISNTSGIPTLLCGGMPVISSGYVMGQTIKATANTSFSFKEAEGQLKSTSIYKTISKAVDKYERKMKKKGITVNKTVMKKLFLQTSIKNMSKFKMALNKMEKEEKPGLLLKGLK